MPSPKKKTEAVKPTPGPWDWSGKPDTRQAHRVFAVIGGTSREIAEVGTLDESRRSAWSETNTANAHLIAAAPDLLEALEKVLGLAEIPNVPHLAATPGFFRVLDMARAAISKARGGA